jgi:hypothetical protein
MIHHGHPLQHQVYQHELSTSSSSFPIATKTTTTLPVVKDHVAVVAAHEAVPAMLAMSKEKDPPHCRRRKRMMHTKHAAKNTTKSTPTSSPWVYPDNTPRYPDHRSSKATHEDAMEKRPLTQTPLCRDERDEGHPHPDTIPLYPETRWPATPPETVVGSHPDTRPASPDTRPSYPDQLQHQLNSVPHSFSRQNIVHGFSAEDVMAHFITIDRPSSCSRIVYLDQGSPRRMKICLCRHCGVNATPDRPGGSCSLTDVAFIQPLRAHLIACPMTKPLLSLVQPPRNVWPAPRSAAGTTDPLSRHEARQRDIDRLYTCMDIYTSVLVVPLMEGRLWRGGGCTLVPLSGRYLRISSWPRIYSIRILGAAEDTSRVSCFCFCPMQKRIKRSCMEQKIS